LPLLYKRMTLSRDHVLDLLLQPEGWPGGQQEHAVLAAGRPQPRKPRPRRSSTRNGKPLDRIKDGTLTVKEQGFVIKTKSGTELKGDLRIDPSKKPKTMDFVHLEGLLRDKT
jgi:hypothetical protein